MDPLIEKTPATEAAAEPPVEVSTTVSWHDPHPIFVIIMVGKDEVPFGIQKDLLCARSPFFREHFSQKGEENKVEHIVKLPDTNAEIFGCFQNFLYTGHVYDSVAGRAIPEYPQLMGVWKLATHLKVAPLRVAVLTVMAERRQRTRLIPGTELLKQAWEETEEGSDLRQMLIKWAAEHMRSSPEARNAFAKSLPQEILSELVIVMSDLPATPTFVPQAITKHPHLPQPNEAEELSYQSPYQSSYGQPAPKRARKSEPISVANGEGVYEVKSSAKKAARKSEALVRQPKVRMTNNSASSAPVPMDADHELAFCRDLITRMLSGPGFWTRLVGPFKDPVDPDVHKAPNYFDVVKRPMDLKTIKAKMDRNEYKTAAGFEADIRLIFKNCFEYWTPDDRVFRDCEKFEEYFNEKWSNRDKWVISGVKSELLD
ncbi:hypothetical protein HYFRA_00002650 [Hymenoscyphus fraxineus]|uniref:Uncharacterized protein n=1 Tax=Hymenoscyphus fraxineus TaxID=746836 RepID=A0A9N9LCS8_9HELO|nr:hypothetical protein HYFRA_00002650 [Hymenoscyphus fraxineus]